MLNMDEKVINFLEKSDYETPFFVFSKKDIVDKYYEFKKYFPGAIIHYALKANAEKETLKTLLKVGASFEVASRYELDMLKKIKVPARRIIYGTSVKQVSHIRAFYQYGVDRFAFDSLGELEKIAEVIPKAKVYCRVVVNDSGSVYRFSEKFGTDIKNIIVLLDRARELGLHPYGISFHVGSQASNKMIWAEALKSLHEPLMQLKKIGITLDVINIGGGFPCTSYTSSDYDFDIKDIADYTMDQYRKLPYHPMLILEPGRAIVAQAGVLVTTVIARIDRAEHTWLFLDAGVYNALFESLSYQGSTRYKITSVRPVTDQGESLFALAGPTGDSWDIITREALLPRDIAIGDKILFHDVGAYNTVFMSRFNGFPDTPVYFI